LWNIIFFNHLYNKETVLWSLLIGFGRI